MEKNHEVNDYIHSDELQGIISKPPSWLLTRGISFILLTVILLLGVFVFIKYPEMVIVEMRFTTTNSPKVIVNEANGVLKKILVKDGEMVSRHEDIAYLESTADHEQVISLLENLKELRKKDMSLTDLHSVISPINLNLGELQGSYESFYLSYINYQAIQEGGIYQKRKDILEQEVNYVNDQKHLIQRRYGLQARELQLAEDEYERFKQLADKKIISLHELQQKEAILLSKRQALPSMENMIISNQTSMLSKSREIAEMENDIIEEEKKFVQSLNSLISEAEEWKKKHVLTTPVDGKLIYSGLWQPNQYIKAGEELFYINPEHDDYYGEIYIPQVEIAKVTNGQDVLIKVRSYPYQEYGYLRGKVGYISDIPIRDSVYFAKVDLMRTSMDSLIHLKPGSFADSEIITADVSILKRIWMNMTNTLSY